MKSLSQFLESEKKEFDEKFGIKGVEGNSDSIGRRAGCDDCSANVEWREEQREFLQQSHQRILAYVREMIEGKKEECEVCENHEKHDTPRNKILDEILSLLTITK